MHKVVVIHQPDFMPYCGFFHRFLYADLWVVFDNVQFVASSRSWHNRDRIKTKDGAAWLTVAVNKCPRNTLIKDVILSSNVDWRSDNLNLIEQNYRKAGFYAEIFPYVDDLYRFKCDKLIDFNMRSIRMLMNMLGLDIEAVSASELNPSGKKNDLLVDILRRVSGEVYLTGTGSRDYLDEALFERNGFRVCWQNFEHPVYPQLHGDFVPYLSALDMLFNCGITESRKLLRRSGHCGSLRQAGEAGA